MNQRRDIETSFWVSIILTIFIFAGLYFVTTHHFKPSTVSACSTAEECQAEIDAAKKKRDDLQKEQSQMQQNAASAKQQIENIIAQIQTYSTQITAVEVTITNLKAQEVALQESIDKKDALLKKRLKDTQLSLETNANLEFIANSSSITDMIERAQVIGSVTEADKELIDQLAAQKVEIEKNRKEQEEKKVELEGLIKELDALKASKQKELEEYLAAAAAAASAAEKAMNDADLSQAQLDAINAAKRSAPTVASGSAIQNERVAFAYFVSLGYTKAGAAGIIGNFYIESTMDPTKMQYGGGPGRGLAQWEDSQSGGSGRWNKLQSWAAQSGLDPWALGTQLAFTVYELEARPNLNALLKSSNDIATTTEQFERSFEAPACMACTLPDRIAYAQAAYNRNA